MGSAPKRTEQDDDGNEGGMDAGAQSEAGGGDRSHSSVGEVYWSPDGARQGDLIT